MQEVLAAATRSSEVEGLALLREDPWQRDSHFMSGVLGLADGMASGTDWRELRAQLTAMLGERQRNRTGNAADTAKAAAREQQRLDQALALRWANDDIRAAVNWYVNELTPPESSGSTASRTVDLLGRLPREDRGRVLDWFEDQRSHEHWDDMVLVGYAKRLASQTPDAEIEHMAAMPMDERNRAAFVSAFVTPVKQGGQLVLRHEPEPLLRLMEAANLSAATVARLRGLMIRTGWKPGDLPGLGEGPG